MNVRMTAITMLACLALGAGSGALAGNLVGRPGATGPAGPPGAPGPPGPRGASTVASGLQSPTTGICVSVDSRYDLNTSQNHVTDVKVWTPRPGCIGGTFVATAP